MRAWTRKTLALGSVAAVFWRQRRIPGWPPERIRAERDANVRRMVRHAAATVPHYRELFRREGIDPRRIRTAEDLARLPLLSKAELRRDPDRFLSRSRAGRDSVDRHTSGSTGEPLQFRVDRRSHVRRIAYDERERAVIRRVVGRERGYREARLDMPGGPTERRAAGRDRLIWRPVRTAERLSLPMMEPVERNVEALNAFRPHVVRGFGAYLEGFYRTAVARGLALHRPRMLVYGGEAMSDEGVRLLEEELGIPVFASYHVAEGGNVGFTCEAKALHCNDDLCHLRLVDGEGRTVEPGEPGEVVISNLTNRATVFLQYRTGDRARRASGAGACACGRGLPRLERLEGRVDDILPLPDGRLLSPLGFYEEVGKRPEVLRFRVIQHDLRRIELQLVTPDAAAFERARGPIREGLERRIRGGARLEIRRVDAIEPAASGKLRPIVSHVPSPGA